METFFFPLQLIVALHYMNQTIFSDSVVAV